MAYKGSVAFAVVAGALTFSMNASFAAQTSDNDQDVPPPRIVVVPGRGNVLVQPYVTDDLKAKPRTVIVPGRGEVYVVPVRPKDTRTVRQRCIDRETDEVGGSPTTTLDDAASDLKCSQR